MSTLDAIRAERAVARLKRDHADEKADQRWFSGYTEGLEFALALLEPEDTIDHEWCENHEGGNHRFNMLAYADAHPEEMRRLQGHPE